MRRILRGLWEECVSFAAFIGELYMLICGDMILFTGAGYGLCLLGMAGGAEVYDMQLYGPWEQFFGAVLGVLLMAGCGCSLVLRYGKRLFGRNRFRLQAAVRKSFLLAGPAVAAMKYSWLMTNAGVWTLAVVPLCTIVPFGLSLRSLILKQRNA